MAVERLSPILERNGNRMFHWCPACEVLHPVFDGFGWKWNGDVDKPTFTPSFKHSGKRLVVVDGKWNGEWHRDEDGHPIDGTCHYIITDGQIQFCSDSWHKRSDIVAMPPIPANVSASD
jgi:hypothetical protein